MRRTDLVVLASFVVLTLAGCDRKAAASGSDGWAAPAPAASNAPVAGAPGGTDAAPGWESPVTRIVFLDKENCCQCTRAATDASWAALQEALGDASIPIERIHVDTQADQAGPYQGMQAMMAVPGIYFLDASGGLVGMLQGEVTAAQVGAVLFP